MTRVTHGTLDYAEVAALGYQPEDLIVFSSNINPYGPPAAVVDAVRQAATRELIARYPDRHSFAVRRALAAYHGVAENTILVGNGTADILWLLALVSARRQRVAIVEPTFGEYENAVKLLEAQVAKVCHPGWQQNADGTYAPGATTLAETAATLTAAAPAVIFICNPNNPTGHHLTPDELLALHAAAPQALWVVDEAYAEFAPHPWSAARWLELGQWLILRSLTKDFALGGLRLGYALAAPALIEQMAHAQAPWNVNGLAQVAAVAALQQPAWRNQSLAQLRQDCAELQAHLRQTGFRPLATTTNYFLLPVADPTATRSALLHERLMVRDCTSFGLPHHIRIAAQLPEQNALLVAALARLHEH